MVRRNGKKRDSQKSGTPTKTEEKERREKKLGGGQRFVGGVGWGGKKLSSWLQRNRGKVWGWEAKSEGGLY